MSYILYNLLYLYPFDKHYIRYISCSSLKDILLNVGDIFVFSSDLLDTSNYTSVQCLHFRKTNNLLIQQKLDLFPLCDKGWFFYPVPHVSVVEISKQTLLSQRNITETLASGIKFSPDIKSPLHRGSINLLSWDKMFPLLTKITSSRILLTRSFLKCSAQRSWQELPSEKSRVFPYWCSEHESFQPQWWQTRKSLHGVWLGVSKTWGLFSYKQELFLFVHIPHKKDNSLLALCFDFMFEVLLLRLYLLLQTPGHLHIMKYSNRGHIAKPCMSNLHWLEV